MCSDPLVNYRCLATFGSGDGQGDILEYWFGAYLMNYGAGLDDDGNVFPLNGVANPFVGLDWTINGADSAQNQTVASSFITTSGILPVAEYPQFDEHGRGEVRQAGRAVRAAHRLGIRLLATSRTCRTSGSRRRSPSRRAAAR